jgi:hypothetical protein
MDWQFENVSAIIFGACVALMNKPLAEFTESWNRAAMKMEGGAASRRLMRVGFILGGLFFIAVGVFGR